MSVTRDRQPRSEAGVTVVELVIVVMILGIVVTAIFGAMNALTSTERRAQNRVQAQEDIRQALTDMARDLRSATLIDAPSSISYAASNISFTRSDGKHGRWRLDSGTLYGEIENTPGGGTWTTIRVHKNIRNADDGTAMIQYYGSGNQRLESSTTLTDLATCSLRLRLTLKAAPKDVSSPYSASLDVGLRNNGSRGVPGC